jgi:hypothetical protein
VGWVDGQLEVDVVGPAGQTVVLCIAPACAGTPSLLRSDRLALYYRGTGLWPELRERLAAVGLSRFAGESAAALAALVEVDPADAAAPDGGHAASAAEVLPPASASSGRGSTPPWCRFFAAAETDAARLDPVDVTRHGTVVRHCGRDSLQVAPHAAIPLLDEYNFPWGDRLRQLGWPRRPGGAPEQPAPGAGGPAGTLTTDLGATDIATGALDRLTAVLEHAVARGIAELLVVDCSEVPSLDASSAAAVAARCATRAARPCVVLTSAQSSSAPLLGEVLVRRRLEAEARVTAVDAHAVNLVGFARGPALAELRGLLAAAGVSVNATLVPELDPSAVDALPRAPLHVLAPNARWRDLYDLLLCDTRLRAITPAAPFGLAGTRAWLAAVAAAAAVGAADADAVVERALAPLRGEWEELRAQAVEQRLGLVVGREDVRRLCDPAETWGVPLLRMTEELGFGLDILIHVGDRRDAQDAAAQVHTALGDPGRHRIRGFRDEARLVVLLESGPFGAVFSEHAADARLRAAGLAQFSLQEFEPGLRGAVRTLRRLLAACRLPFFRRYRRFVRPPRGAAACGGRAPAAPVGTGTADGEAP